jgi:ribose transport system permease protein
VRDGWRDLRDRALLLAAWLGLVILFGLLTEHFLSLGTFLSVAGRLPALAVVAAGMTLVIVAGGIDLAVGSVAALAAAVLGVALVDWHWPLAAAALLAVGVGSVAGLAGGVVAVGLRIPPFLATLGLLEICRGAAYLVTGSRTKYIGAAIEPLARPLPVVGVPPTVLVALCTVALVQVVLSRTVFGRHLRAVGGNPAAARLAGIDCGRVRCQVHAVSGALAGLAAVLATARLGSADPNAGIGLELAAIAAVVIGGTSLAGGSGSAIGSLLGVVIIVTLEAGLAQLGASDPVKRIVTGGAIVAAVAVDALRRGPPRGRAAS